MQPVISSEEYVQKDYFLETLSQLGLSEAEAGRYGLSVDAKGNILQTARHFDGRPVRYLPKYNRRKYKRLQARKTGTNIDPEEVCFISYQVKRHHPSVLARSAGTKQSFAPAPGKSLPRYLMPAGEPTRVLPTPSAIEAYCAGRRGGTVFFIEGYKKAIALDRLGFESVAFLGITHYKLDAETRAYLKTRRPEQVVIAYDADALQHKSKNGKPRSRRVEDFRNSAARFAQQFFELVEAEELETKLYFQMVHPDAPEKGVDDLVYATGDRAGIAGELAALDASSSGDDVRSYFSRRRGDAAIDFPPTSCAGKSLLDRASDITHDQIDQNNTAQRGQVPACRAGRAAIDIKNKIPRAQYFVTFRLYKTTYERRLSEFFGLNLYRSFWKRFQRDIGEQPFVYKGAKYRAAHFGNLFHNHKQHFELLTDPFRIEIPRISMQIQRFLGELREPLAGLLDTHERVALQAPTGAGKTTFFLNYARRTGTKMVITVPTVLLAQQLERNYQRHCAALYGRIDYQKKERALNANIVVCTYDTLHHVDDLATRILVVDEAHNLVNQCGEVRYRYRPFRVETLRCITELFDKAKKLVAISGTMPELLCKAFDMTLVEVTRSKNNLARIYQIESEGTRGNYLTATLLSHLGKIDFSNDRIHFVYYNHTDELTYVRDYLVEKGILQKEEIEIITRYHYNCGEHRIFHEIAQSSEIKTKVKLVLCTCLIAEGVNINNTNIGRIYTVGIRCPDSFRQFIARFRKMAVLDVFCIQPRERDLAPDFFLPAGIELAEAIERGELQARHLERRREACYEDLDADELPYADQIADAFHYEYTSEIFREIYFRDGRPIVDRLRILAGIRDRMLASANNCYFYSQLNRYPNIKIYAAEDYYVEDSIKDEVQASRKEQQANREGIEANLRGQLLADPATLVKAFYLYYQRAGNRLGTGFLKRLAAGLLEEADETEAKKLLSERKEQFQKKWYRKIIRTFVRLHFIDCPPDVIAEELERPTKEFEERWQAFITWAELRLYENKRRRKLLRAVHREDIRAKYFIQKHLLKAGPQITVRELRSMIQTIFNRRSYSRDLSVEVVEQVALVNDAQAERLLRALFRVRNYGHGARGGASRQRRFEILEKWDDGNVPFLADSGAWMRRNWLKIIDLCALGG